MKKLLHLFIPIFIILLFSYPCNAQTLANRAPVIQNAVEEISATNLENTVHDLTGFHTRHNLSSQTDPKRGIGAASEYIHKKASSYIPASEGRLSVKKVFYNAGGPDTRLGREVELCNVVATVKGSNPADNRIIVLLAHYDSRVNGPNDFESYAPGANDDGSGVACLMEITRITSTIDIPVTLKIMFLSGEEHGLLGAQHMSELAKKENWNIIAVINNDMIGNSDASGTGLRTNMAVRVFSENIPVMEDESQTRIRIYNSAENDSPSRQLARYIKETGERYVDNMTVKLIYRNDRFGRGGDHTPFSRNGFTAVRVCEMGENYDRTHQTVREENGIKYGDEISGVDFEYVRKNTGVNLATVLNMAMAPDVAQNVKLDASGLSNYSEISWEAPLHGKQPAAYYVLIRETDQSMWQKKILVKDTKVRIPYSRDNYFFAVQAMDERGCESLAVFAAAGR